MDITPLNLSSIRSIISVLKYVTISKSEVSLTDNKLCQFFVKRLLRCLSGTSTYYLHTFVCSSME